MSRALIIIRNDVDRQRATRLAHKAPVGTRVEFKATKRSLPQNAKMHAMLTEVSRQLRWDGIELTSDDWKLVFIDALKREVRIVRNIDGTGVVNLSRSSSDLSKAEMADLISLIEEFGARHSVMFNDPRNPPRSDGRSPNEDEAA